MTSWRGVPLDEVPDTEPEPPTIGGLFYASKLNRLLGGPEAGKSWLAAAIMLDVLRAGQPVVWIDFEQGARDVKRRLRALGATEDDLRGAVLVEPDTPIEWDDVVSCWLELPPALV